MDPSLGNLTTPKEVVRKPCNQRGGDHSYIKEPTHIGHTQNGDNNLQLVHLLTTNPAAALPAIFPASGSQQKVYARQTFHLNRPRISSISNSYRGVVSNHRVVDGERIMVNSWTASVINERVPLRRQRSFSELYASKEEIDKKACCVDREGNFNFDALLPAVYWRPEEKDFTLLSDS